MHRLVPEFILEQYSMSEMAGSFAACTLFVDISGFTAITDVIMGHGQHGAEVLANIIQDTFDPLIKSVLEQGGFVTNLAGDAFTAVFPVDEHLPNSFQRGLAAAWQMQQEMKASARQQTPYGRLDLSVKVGIATGQVDWGIVSSMDKGRSVYYFRGAGIDGATEAQKHAKAGEIIGHSSLLPAFGPAVSTEPVGENFCITAVNSELPPPRKITLHALDPEILIRFFQAETTRPDLSGEFRQVVSIFINLPSLQTKEQLELFMQNIFDLQALYGGFLNRLDFGDKGANLLLFWGAPTAHETDVMRALNFIIDLQARTIIPINAGITYRIALAGYSGGSLAGEYTCHGRGTTLAARLMQSAPRGEIWMDENVAAQADLFFEVAYEGEMAFKGFAEKQKVFVLLDRMEKTDQFYTSKLVGRQAEQAKLNAFIEPLWQGLYAGLMMIWGEPGIGKSHLVHGFFEQLAKISDLEFSFFICQSDEILQNSLNPFRYWLHRYFEQSEQQSDIRNKRSFNRKLDRLIADTPVEGLRSELDRTRSFLGSMINLTWPDSLYQQLNPQGRYENSLTSLLTLLLAESLQRPIVLLLEDIHWLDQESKDFLQLLFHQDPKYPLAIITTGRLEGEHIIWGNQFEHHEIHLDRITVNEQASLAADQLGAPIGSDLLALLEKRAEGNPFFTEQVLRYLQEQDLLLFIGGKWQLKAKQDTALPANVRALLVARLDRLTQNVKEVVQTAAVLGREFEIQLLVYMLQDLPMVRDLVAQAESMSIWLALNELRYLFKHTLLRDAAYRMQIRSRRQSLHKLAVEAMEYLYAEDITPHFGELAYHAEQANLVNKARYYLELAGKAAKESYENSLALDYFTRALNLTPNEELESHFQLLITREELYGQLGARQAQRQDLHTLIELANQLNDISKQLQVSIAEAWFYWWTADYQASLAASERAVVLGEQNGQKGLAVEAIFIGMWVKIQQGLIADARQLGEKALVYAQQAGEQHLESRILSGLGLISRAEGDYYTALKRSEEALLINRKIENRTAEGTGLGNLGVALMSLGDYQAAKHQFLQALAINREIGSRVSAGSDLINLSWNAGTLGKWESAIEFAEEGITIMRAVKQSEMEAEGLLWLGHAYLGRGRLDEAIDAYEDSLTIRRELGQEHLAMGVIAGLARAAVHLGDINSATSFVGEIVAYLAGGGSLASTWEPLRIYLTCYQVLQLTQDSQADKILEIAYQELIERSSKILDLERRRHFLVNVPWHREIVAAYRAKTPSN